MKIGETAAGITYDDLPPVHFDAMRLSQIFQNLIGNALKYRSDKPPRIEITAKLRGAEVIFSVRNNGIGIDPKYYDQIFGIFKRLHGREYEGSGIGLAMVKK